MNLIRIGMAKSFFHEQPKALVEIVAEPFPEVMKKACGLNGELQTGLDALEIARKLNSKELEFGIMYGHEFAWAREKYPGLTPFMTVTGRYPEERAYLVVHKDSPAKSIADLRGKSIEVPITDKQYARVYLESLCVKEGQSTASFFGKVIKPTLQEAALDNVANKKMDAALVDSFGLELYKEIKGPVFAKSLRILHQSDPFPATVVVHKQGNVSDETLNALRTGLQKAPDIPEGRDLMKLWMIQAFQPVPKEYDRSLAAAREAYPIEMLR